MKFSSFASKAKNCSIINFHDFEVSGINYDFRKVKPNNIYIAMDIFNYHGEERDGHEFINQVIKNGAKTIVVKKKQNVNKTICQIITSNPRKILEKFSSFFYGYPGKKLYTIGVTGTKGKTTTIYLINHILEQNGIKTGFFSSADFKICSKFIPNYTDRINETHLTCPESLELQKSLNEMYKYQIKVAIIEATSHALQLYRAAEECYYDIGVMTNLQCDHLDFHKTKRNYYSAKAKLFGLAKCAIVNNDDLNCQFIKNRTSSRIVSYSLKEASDFKAYDIEYRKRKSAFRINKQKFILPLIGGFNIYNACAAIATASNLGLSHKKIASALRSFPGIPGRMQKIKNKKGLNIFIDSAHTPESLEECLRTLRKNYKNKLVVVFGCAGNRDKSKRPKMGEIASRLADFTFITLEDPRFEKPEQIAQEIISGIDQRNYTVELNRKIAITKALKKAKRGDVVVIAGKGDEKYFEFAGKQITWSDTQIVKNNI